MIIALATNDIEVELIQQQFGDKFLDWIALEPFCIPKLQALEIDFKSVDDFFDPLEIFNEVSEASDEKVKRLIALTDSWVKRIFNPFGETGLSLLKYYLFYLTILFDGILFRLWVLKKIISSLEPVEVIICKKRAAPTFSTRFPWHASETVWAYCAEFLQAEADASWRIIEYGNRTSSQKNIGEESVLNVIRDIFPASYDILKRIGKEGFRSGLKSLRYQNIVSFDLDYQWKKTEALFRHQGYKFIEIGPFSKMKERKASKVDYVAAAGLSDLLHFAGSDISPLVRDKLNSLISFGLTCFPQVFKKAKSVFSRVRAKAAVFSTVTDPRRWVMLEAAKASGIPVFCWGHGASGQTKFTKQKQNELLICDYYLAQGDGSRVTYEGYQMSSRKPTKVLSVGLPSVDSVNDHNRKNNAEYLFLYVITGYYQHNFYFSFYPGVFPTKLFKAVNVILSFLKGIDQKSLIKTASEPMALYDQHRSDNLSFEREKQFPELIHKARAIIIDAPTTTLLEALTTSKPVFVLSEFVKLNDLAHSLLKKRVIVRDNVNDLVSSMQKYAFEGIYDADVFDTEYLKAFGTHKNDGKSAQRGVEAVLNVIGTGGSGFSYIPA